MFTGSASTVENPDRGHSLSTGSRQFLSPAPFSLHARKSANQRTRYKQTALATLCRE